MFPDVLLRKATVSRVLGPLCLVNTVASRVMSQLLRLSAPGAGLGAWGQPVSKAPPALPFSDPTSRRKGDCAPCVL